MNQFLDALPLYLFIALAVAALAMVPAVVFVFLRDRSKTRYDTEKREVALSAMRNTYETQIAELAQRLTATEERWQEVNHLIIASQEVQAEVLPPIHAEYIPLLSELHIRQDEIPVDNNLVFVLTPFADSEIARSAQSNMLAMHLDWTAFAAMKLTPPERSYLT
jgi:hypothetical protein